MITLICLATTVTNAWQAAHGVGIHWGPERLVTGEPGIAQGVVGRNIAVDSTNTIHLAYVLQTGSSVKAMYRRSSNEGRTWSAPFDLGRNPLPAFSPNLAVGPDDVLHATWGDRRNGGGTRVFYARSFDGGQSWEAGRDISGPNTQSAGPALISVDQRNRVHIAWHVGEPDNPSAPASICYYRRSADGGANFDPVIRLSTATGRHAGFPRFTVEGATGDTIAIAWRDNRRNPDWDAYVAVSTDGGLSFVERPAIATSQRDWDPEAAVDRSGRIHVACMTYRVYPAITIDYVRSTNSGLSWSSPSTLSETRGRFPFFAPDNRNGALWLFWKDERDYIAPNNFRADMVCRYTRNGGSTWPTAEFATDLGDEELKFPCITVTPSGFPVLAWSDRRIDAGSEQVYVKIRDRLIPRISPRRWP
jgi:hypothetical protein